MGAASDYYKVIHQSTGKRAASGVLGMAGAAGCVIA